MENRKSLVDEDILNIFGNPSFLDIDELIKNINLLKNHIPQLNSEKNFFQNVKKDFVINEKTTKLTYVYKNLGAYFSDCINWNSPKTQFNITPPVTIPSVAVMSLVNLINPNLVWDFASGGFAQLEREMVKYVSSLVDWKDSSGIFTFGGTGTNMYAVKLGINKCDNKALKKGVKDTVVISNDEGHSCHITICNWLGIGTNNCIRLGTQEDGTVNVTKLLDTAEKLIKENKKIACIILNGGTNFNGKIDSIRAISEGIKDLKDKYKINYNPHIHVDSVIGWVFLLFKEYNFEKNKLNFPSSINNKLKCIYNKIRDISYADSFGVDFHKTGFCPYISSLFIVKEKSAWRLLSGDEGLFTHQAFNFGDYKPGQFTLETSRSVNGVVTAYITLNSLGIDGIRKICANYLYLAEDLRTRINDSECFENCNYDALGWATLFIAREKDSYLSYYELYETENEEKLKRNNLFQKSFYDFLIKKYDNKLLWNIGFSKCYTKNKYGYPISALKNYPMSPFTTISDNKSYIDWLKGNLEEFRNDN